jgi:hypothetical protein
MRLRSGGTALAVIAFAIAGCGGGDDAPSKAEYIGKADAICKKGNDEIAKGAAALGASPTPDEATTFAKDKLIPNIEGQLSDLRDLDKPDGDGDTIDAITDALQSGLDKAKADPSSLVSGDAATTPFADANAKADAYGLKVCGKG